MEVGPDLPVLMSLSGKGGVGKSIFSIGETAALARRLRVGLLDIDVRSPNIPYLLRLPGTVETDAQGRPDPCMTKLGGRDVPVFSSSFIFGDGTSITMPGEQIRSTIRDMIYDVNWGDLDCLVVDVDPGPGDSLTAISRFFRHVSAFIVSTSDVSSLQDCDRMVDACANAGISVRGIVANMVGAVCPRCSGALVCHECGADVSYGDEASVRELADRVRVPFLGSLPWNPRYRWDPVAMVDGGPGRHLFDELAVAYLRGGALEAR